MRRSSRTCLARVSRPGQRLDRGGVLLYHATCSMMARGAAPRLLVLERRLRLREGSASGVPEGTGEVGRQTRGGASASGTRFLARTSARAPPRRSSHAKGYTPPQDGTWVPS